MAQRRKHTKAITKDSWFLSVLNMVLLAYLKKIHLSGFLAIIMKHIVNLKYFFDIRSLLYVPIHDA